MNPVHQALWQKIRRNFFLVRHFFTTESLSRQRSLEMLQLQPTPHPFHRKWNKDFTHILTSLSLMVRGSGWVKHDSWFLKIAWLSNNLTIFKAQFKTRLQFGRRLVSCEFPSSRPSRRVWRNRLQRTTHPSRCMRRGAEPDSIPYKVRYDVSKFLSAFRSTVRNIFGTIFGGHSGHESSIPTGSRMRAREDIDAPSGKQWMFKCSGCRHLLT